MSDDFVPDNLTFPPNPPLITLGGTAITLRDLYAGFALFGFVSSLTEPKAEFEAETDPATFRTHADEVAQICFIYADALLMRRKP